MIKSFELSPNLLNIFKLQFSVVDTEKVTNLVDGYNKVLGKVDTVEIVNEYLNGDYGYELNGGVLKVYVGDRNALSGFVRLQVTQYNGNDEIIATGTVTLGEVNKK